MEEHRFFSHKDANSLVKSSIIKQRFPKQPIKTVSHLSSLAAQPLVTFSFLLKMQTFLQRCLLT